MDSAAENPVVFKAVTRARSSAGEHLVDIEGVTGSIPVVPTTENPGQKPGFLFGHDKIMISAQRARACPPPKTP